MAHPRWGGVGSGGEWPLLAAVSGVDAQSPPFSEGLAKVFQRRGQTGQLTLLGGPQSKCSPGLSRGLSLVWPGRDRNWRRELGCWPPMPSALAQEPLRALALQGA